MSNRETILEVGIEGGSLTLSAQRLTTHGVSFRCTRSAWILTMTRAKHGHRLIMAPL